MHCVHLDEQLVKLRSGLPTWTGRFGSAGKLGFAKRGGSATPNSGNSTDSSEAKSSLSSSAILQNIRYRRELQEKAQSTSPANTIDGLSSNPIVSANAAERAKVIESIRDYLAGLPDHRAKSADIFGACRMTIDGIQEVATVRQMLKEISVWKSDVSMWEL